jgi:hypothetical protein
VACDEYIGAYCLISKQTHTAECKCNTKCDKVKTQSTNNNKKKQQKLNFFYISRF